MSQLSALCEEKGLTIEAKHVRFVGRSEDNDNWPHNEWKVTVRYKRRRMTTTFRTGTGISEPTAADVISSLLSDARCGEVTFEEFCTDFGYDSDSRKAEATWKACRAVRPKVWQLLGEDFDLFAEAEH